MPVKPDTGSASGNLYRLRVMSYIIDAHCHLSDRDYDDLRDDIIGSMGKNGLLALINPASDLESAKAGLELAKREKRIFACLGTHPLEARSYDDQSEQFYRENASNEKVVAIGEIGLDYHYEFETAQIQKDILERQFQLASDLDLPVVVHCREAHNDCYAIIKNFPGLKILMHSYSEADSGSWKLYDELGAYISFGGMLTFKNSENVRDIARMADPQRIMMETDGPYLAPVPKRGKTNRPEWAWYSLLCLADVLKRDAGELADLLLDNTVKFYGIESAVEKIKGETDDLDLSLGRDGLNL